LKIKRVFKNKNGEEGVDVIDFINRIVQVLGEDLK
jgi:hypothetical protein